MTDMEKLPEDRADTIDACLHEAGRVASMSGFKGIMLTCEDARKIINRLTVERDAVMAFGRASKFAAATIAKKVGLDITDVSLADVVFAVDGLVKRATRAEAMNKVLVETVRSVAYTQGTDSDGWFRLCKFCGEESRIATHVEPLGTFPHSVACVLSPTARHS